LLGDFPAPESPAAPSVVATSDFSPAEAYADIVESPNLLLRWKLRLQPLRPLLHSLMFFVPALVWLCLTSRRRAILLAAALACAIEAAQCAFGYGFNGYDALDLTSDAFGIALAVGFFTVARKLVRGGKSPSLVAAPLS
jgi:hypothetical protein